ncbi:MAG: hypothetical protein PUB10_03740 [Clostridiales bacterium]|nr:hypothetical protein [Clostridiales bacterium]
MRVDRVVQMHEKISDYRQKDKVYHEILDEYSVADTTAEDLITSLEVKWGLQYTPEKLGNSEIRQKAECSDRFRKKVADMAARILCTDCHSLNEYKNLSTLLDYSCTPEADRRNQQITKLLTQGSQKVKDRTFLELLKPLTLAQNSVLEGKTDEELVENWEQLAPALYQSNQLEQIVAEAETLDIGIKPEMKQQLQQFCDKAKLPCMMTLNRAGIIASPYYARINDEDLRKLDSSVLRETAKEASFTLADYLNDIEQLSHRYEEHIRDQLGRKLAQLGYQEPGKTVLGDLRGRPYDVDKAVEVLKTGRPVYVIGEKRKLLHTIETVGNDGFLKPIGNKNHPPSLEKYLADARKAAQKLAASGQTLSEEGRQEARMYMAKMVCFQKLLNEKRLGNGQPGRLEKAIGGDEQKFARTAERICQDAVFQKITNDITTKSLEEFINTRGEQELNRRYIKALAAEKAADSSPKTSIAITKVAMEEPEQVAEPVPEPVPSMS